MPGVEQAAWHRYQLMEVKVEPYVSHAKQLYSQLARTQQPPIYVQNKY